MVDECKHCSARGDLEKCEGTSCTLHESWYVETLLEKIDELEIAMDRWISVKDRLPETIGSYIVKGSGKIAWAFYNSDGDWCYDNSRYTNLTHWQPLPVGQEV